MEFLKNICICSRTEKITSIFARNVLIEEKFKFLKISNIHYFKENYGDDDVPPAVFNNSGTLHYLLGDPDEVSCDFTKIP